MKAARRSRSRTPLDSLDWAALWEEFGAAYDDFMSRTQLVGALEVTEQNATGALPEPGFPGDDHAPDDLVAQWAHDEDGLPIIRGYKLVKEVRP